jgi:uncharacterized 2Fe-2S/4Fe-4S cluster protein (DUF4445 family)
MSMHKVVFLPHNKEIMVQDGENLLRAAMEAGVHINASCGGEGVCGKCRVIIEDGDVEGGITEKLSQEDIEKGYRLACAACSAGPAFEGGGLKFGMRAAKGAIEDFSMDPITLEPMNLTIGNVRC